MRKPQTLKRAVMIGATALLGISAAIGTAHASGADTSGTQAATAKAEATFKGKDKANNTTTSAQKTTKHKIGEDGSEFCFIATPGDEARMYSADAKDESKGLKVSTKQVTKVKGKGSEPGEFCFIAKPVDKPAPKK